MTCSGYGLPQRKNGSSRASAIVPAATEPNSDSLVLCVLSRLATLQKQVELGRACGERTGGVNGKDANEACFGEALQVRFSAQWRILREAFTDIHDQVHVTVRQRRRGEIRHVHSRA